MSNTDYLDGLNPAQKEAVEYTEGPLLVLAGAGSGKTRVITHRIVHLIHKGVAPYQILAVTFTNKAAKEMRERVEELVHKYPPSDRASIDSLPTVTTFHAFGVRTLREFHDILNLRRHFVIYDRSDSLKAIKASIEKANYSIKEFEPRKILGIISRAKGDALSQGDWQAEASTYPEKVAAEVWRHYDELMRKEHALDFDDLLLKTLFLLKSYPHVREVLHKRYRYLHIDEYQDTNKVQFEIVKQLVNSEHNLCVVGDIDQNIYSWRGADIKNVLHFEQVFPSAKTILLEENYRSTKNIISASNNVISKNRNRVEKTVFTSNGEGELITIHVNSSGIEEAEYIASTAQKLIVSGVSPAGICVLYRTNFQSRVLEEAFLSYELPYQLLGTKFFERKEVKDVLSFLRLALNPGSTADISRIANVPARGIGKVTLLKIIEGNLHELKGATLEKVNRFESIISDIADSARTENISTTLRFIMKRTGMEAEFKKEATEEAQSRLENLQELVTLATRYDELDPEAGVEALLENAALQSDQDELKDKSEHDAIRLMTVHAAKGLEFPYVFVAGLEEGLFPHEKLGEATVDSEEERRLFYVALTRAEKKVFLTYANTRVIFGSQKINLPSSFLADLDPELVENTGNEGMLGAKSGYEKTIWLD